MTRRRWAAMSILVVQVACKSSDRAGLDVRGSVGVLQKQVANGRAVYRCTAIAVTRHLALTAAHCVRKNESGLSFAWGPLRRSPKGQSPIIRLRQHPRFAFPTSDDLQYVHDLAALYLGTPLPFRPKVRLARSAPPSGATCIVLARGRARRPHGTRAKVAKRERGELRLVAPRGAACVGDSGGGVFFNTRLVGIISRGLGEAGRRSCGDAAATDIRAHESWTRSIGL